MKKKTEQIKREDLLTASGVCNRLDISVKTLTVWYKWYESVEEKPENTPVLPGFIQDHARGPRFWRVSDLPQLQTFKEWIPKGRNGLMGKLNNKGRKSAT